MPTVDETLDIIRTAIDSKPINEQIDDAKANIEELNQVLIVAADDEDVLFEYQKFLNAYETLIDLSRMEAYREGFKSGVMLFTRK